MGGSLIAGRNIYVTSDGDVSGYMEDEVQNTEYLPRRPVCISVVERSDTQPRPFLLVKQYRRKYSYQNR